VVDVLANMREQQVRRLPVVNRDKRLVGVVSIGDLSQIEAQNAGAALQGISRPLH
jgi:CBS-domain-containing membrane protein